MSQALVPLSRDEYAMWLYHHVTYGGIITHAYNYPYARTATDKFRAVANFRTGGECGARAVHILPNREVQHIGGELGHNVIFPWDGGNCRYVPVYSDAIFNHIPGVEVARAEQERKDREFIASMYEWEVNMQERARFSDVPSRRR